MEEAPGQGPDRGATETDGKTKRPHKGILAAVCILAGVLVLGGGGAAVWWMTAGAAGEKDEIQTAREEETETSSEEQKDREGESGKKDMADEDKKKASADGDEKKASEDEDEEKDRADDEEKKADAADDKSKTDADSQKDTLSASEEASAGTDKGSKVVFGQESHANGGTAGVTDDSQAASAGGGITDDNRAASAGGGITDDSQAASAGDGGTRGAAGSGTDGGSREIPAETPAAEGGTENQAPQNTEAAGQTDSGQEDYYAHLLALEEQEAAIYGSISGDTASLIEASNQVYQMWDDELNYVYQEYKKTLTEEEFQVLKQEELGWIDARDAAAEQTAQEWSGGSGAAYAVRGTEIEYTKQRVYELAARWLGY